MGSLLPYLMDGQSSSALVQLPNPGSSPTPCNFRNPTTAHTHSLSSINFSQHLESKDRPNRHHPSRIPALVDTWDRNHVSLLVKVRTLEMKRREYLILCQSCSKTEVFVFMCPSWANQPSCKPVFFFVVSPGLVLLVLSVMEKGLASRTIRCGLTRFMTT